MKIKVTHSQLFQYYILIIILFSLIFNVSIILMLRKDSLLFNPLDIHNNTPSMKYMESVSTLERTYYFIMIKVLHGNLIIGVGSFLIWLVFKLTPVGSFELTVPTFKGEKK